MLKIRRSRDRLIFTMGIPIPGKDGLYIETGPWCHQTTICRTRSLFFFPFEDHDLIWFAVSSSLQALHIHNNLLSSLPDELVALRKLFVLVLAFNRFTTIPPVVAFMTNVRISEVENIIMAGNQIEKIPHETLNQMKYAKKVDLRLNQLTLPPSETVKFTIMEHLTHLDIRDNRVTDLDVRCLKTLEYLNCQRNGMFSLQINGNSLKTLFASNNGKYRIMATIQVISLINYYNSSSVTFVNIDLELLNPLRAKFLSWNVNTTLQFLSFLHTDVLKFFLK